MTADIDIAVKMIYDKLFDEFVQCARDCFSSRLVGVYLHGSYAMGCFNPNQSDLDIIAVVDGRISDGCKETFMRRIIRLDACVANKGFEFSVVQKRYCNPFAYPTPFELHYSRTHKARYLADPHNYVATMRGEDKDLAAHFTVINNYGIVLYGAKISDAFGIVPSDCFFDSVYQDIKNAREDVIGNTVYTTLNLCRVAAYLKTGRCMSKKDGGEWARDNLPSEYSDLICEILCCYSTGDLPTASVATLTDFAEYVLNNIDINKPIVKE